MNEGDASGPLNGYRVVELAGVGPTQLAGMLLADMGADVIRVARPQVPELGVPVPERFELMNRGRRSAIIDLKHAQGVEVLLRLCERADALFEGFRPGVMERLGLGPDACMARNPRLVYGRMTGWGQTGPLAPRAGHDHDYIALAGILGCIGERGGPPAYPLNLIGDFGGGALYLAMGMLAALLETAKSGRGQVVDAAVVDGAASMMTSLYGLLAAGLWQEARASNILDGGAHFACPYRTRDGEYVVVAPLEDRFYQEMLDRLGIDDPELREQRMNRERWPEFKDRLQAIFATRTRDEWCAVFEGSDACFAPVLSPSEATQHPHAAARQSYPAIEGVLQPAPAPRFDRTPSSIGGAPGAAGAHTTDVLRTAGLEDGEIRDLLSRQVAVQS